jgi:nucleotide-binding universal stress UspA family protein
VEKQKLLVALDQHSISTELCNYLGKIISGKQDLEICLLHMLPPPPPQLREFRGSEDPQVEEQLDREMDAVCQRWTREAENAARPVFENAISILTRAGVSGYSIRYISRQLWYHRDLADEILKAAEENACQTIVVGRSSFPWFKETFHRHLADRLVSKATGVAIWVVEQPSATEAGEEVVDGVRYSEDHARALGTRGRPA